MSAPLVKIEHLSKTFPPSKIPVFHSLSATIPKGVMVGLVGPDGAGKTTLIRLMAGLLLPSEGKITVAGYDTVQEAEELHERIGYMPQKFGLYEDLTVLQNLNLYAELRGIATKEKEAIFQKLLDFTSLSPFTQRLAGALSGGMKQKLGLACALIQKPTLLLLDEPSVGVDPISRRELWKMVKALLEEGISVVWSTAYLDEAEKCDTVLVLYEGHLLYQGPPRHLTTALHDRTFKVIPSKKNPRQILTAALNEASVMDGTIQGEDVRILLKSASEHAHVLGQFQKSYDCQIERTTPRFEDAFISMLGQKTKGWSELAQQMPVIEKSTKAVIEAKNLVKRFGTFTAADHINFQVKPGEIFGLLGPNGAGKSTTFKMLCGLLKPTAGQAYVKGLDLQVAPAEARSHIGYMAQKFSIYGNLSVQQNLEFFSGIYQLKGEHRKKKINEMIEIFGLHPYLNVSAETLSLGFKQRLALCCAVMHEPEVLFLDEPTSGVDPLTRREFWNHINGLVEKGVTIMVTTHFMDEAEYCDRIALIYRSRLLMLGTPSELKEKAKSPHHPSPSLEDAFIALVQQDDQKHARF